MNLNIKLQPVVLRWVRERAGLSRTALADKLDVSSDRVEGWERSGEITFSLAEKIAQKTHVPFGSLFLSEPVAEELPIPDLRTLGGASVQRPSPDLLNCIEESQIRQDWYREYLISEGEQPLDFVGSISLNTPQDIAAKRIREKIGFQSELRIRAETWEKALLLQMEQIEESGVLVMRNSVVGANTRRPLPVAEFRGFALADDYAPLVFVNGADGKAAQMFTLAHELVHIWIGESGVSNLRQTFASGGGIERFCNAVAAKVLLQDEEVKEFWPQARNRESPWEWLGKRFKLSSLVVLRRLLDLRIISRPLFERAYRQQEEKFAQIAAKTSQKGGDYYSAQRYRVGARLARAVIESTSEGRTPFREALNLLGMKKAQTFERFAKEQFNFSR
jgi:Zn-dependent peptidase ImmA (M78 family)/DNA-binding XRE family transcriptional regulator